MLGDPFRERERRRSQSSCVCHPSEISRPGARRGARCQQAGPGWMSSSMSQLSTPNHSFPRSQEKCILCLRRKKPLSQEWEFVHKPLLSCPFLTSYSVEPLVCLSPAQGKKRLHRFPLLSSMAQSCTPRPQKPSTEMYVIQERETATGVLKLARGGCP